MRPVNQLYGEYSIYNSQLTRRMHNPSKAILLTSPTVSELFSQSIEMHPACIPLWQKLSHLRSECQEVGSTFQEFKRSTLRELDKGMSKLTSFIQRELGNTAQLREELDVVKFSNQTMRKEVVQLREMINDFVKSYNSEIEAKDVEIRSLKNRLGILDSNQVYEEFKSNMAYMADEAQQQKNVELEVIQEVSQYTGSCLQSIREISMPNSAKGSVIQANSNISNLSETHEDSWIEEEKQTSGNKSKTFLNFFRKNIDESIIVHVENSHDDRRNESHTSSVEDLKLGDTDKINLPKSIASPKNMQFLKRSSKKLLLDETTKQNHCIEMKRTPHRRNHSEGDQKSECKSQKHSRSASKTGSKQKIKITSKIVADQFKDFASKNNNSRKTPVTLRPSVHLGGKAYLKKLVKDIRTALQEYKAWEGPRQREVKYDGDKKSGMRWGKGKLLYDNGFEYEGSFVQNYKHGIGTISLNGMVFYEGQWSLDEISGQGYIKSLRNYSESCPKYLWEASYCGQLLENKFHGMGTLFLSVHEKVVAKFVHGVPVGDFTYYNHSDIQFGSWY